MSDQEKEPVYELSRSELLEAAFRFALLYGALDRAELARRVNEAGGTRPYREGALRALDAALDATEGGSALEDMFAEAWVRRYGSAGEGGWDDPSADRPALRVVG